jgi:DNA-binding IclR family transcriptional regulator
MRELHKLTHQPVNLSMRQGDEIVYIERTYSERSGMQVVRAVGGRAPLHLTSVGKLFLAHDDPTPCARLRRTHRPDRPHAQQHHRCARLERELATGAQPPAWLATTKNSNWACAAWPPASSTTRASCWPGLSVSAPADRLEEAGWTA